MKTVKVFSFMACLCLVLSFPLTLSAKTTVLSLSDQNPDTSWGPVHGLQPWVKQVEKATGGRVKIQIYPNQTLAKGRQNWIAVKDGIADMSWNVMTFYTGLAPYAEVITLPGLPFRTGEKGAEVIWKLYFEYGRLYHDDGQYSRALDQYKKCNKIFREVGCRIKSEVDRECYLKHPARHRVFTAIHEIEKLLD